MAKRAKKTKAPRKSKSKKKAGRARVLGAAKGPQPPAAMHVRDIDVIQKDATTRAERRAVLASALANDWAAEDIEMVERIDESAWHGWAMWPRV